MTVIETHTTERASRATVYDGRLEWTSACPLSHLIPVIGKDCTITRNYTSVMFSSREAVARALKLNNTYIDGRRYPIVVRRVVS